MIVIATIKVSWAFPQGETIHVMADAQLVGESIVLGEVSVPHPAGYRFEWLSNEEKARARQALMDAAWDVVRKARERDLPFVLPEVLEAA